MKSSWRRGTTSRLLGKARRSLLRVPIVRHWSDWTYYAALGRHAEQLRSTQQYATEVLDTLRTRRLAQLYGRKVVPHDVVAKARDLCRELGEGTGSRITIESSHADTSAMLPLYAWGLSTANLDLAEAYIGLPVRYLGAAVKRERADGRPDDIRQWHIDVEDRRMLKLIVYLCDVDEGTGPLEYLDREHTERARSKLRYWTGFVNDERMHQVIARDHWRCATGPDLTMIMLDTCRIFHRARPPVARDRYSVTFSYCSQFAYQVYPEFLPGKEMVSALSDHLTERQREAWLHA